MKLFIVCLLFAGALAQKKDYTGYKVFSVTPHNSYQLNYLQELQETRFDIDFWKQAGDVYGQADVMVGPESIDGFLFNLHKIGMEATVMMQDVQEKINWEAENHEKIVAENRARGVSFALNQYHSTDEIHAWMDEIAAANADVSVETLGKSVEGRDIKQLTIGTGGKPVQFFDCMVHAREWIAGASCIWVANEIITGSSGLKDKFDFKFVLPNNPDGYEYSRTSDRMWRKNRSHNSGSSCRGVDPNRNWDANHCGSGSSRDPCSSMYCGPSPFSEPMTKLVSESVKATPNIAFAYSFHSYSQFILSAYCYTRSLPSDFSEMDRTGSTAANAARDVHGKYYAHGSSSNVMYVASGCSTDWYYESAGIINSFTYELRPTQADGNGFILDESQIIPTAEEIFNAIQVSSNSYLNRK